MKNIVGAVPRGNNFFPREDLINKIYNRLDAEAHLYLAAPRRMGKTAIMRNLEDQPRKGYEFKYLVTESIDEPITYLNELAKTLSCFTNWDEHTHKSITERLPEICIFLPNSEIVTCFSWEQHSNTFEKFKEFVKQLQTANDSKAVVMIDEFPQTIRNIENKHGAEVARQFLQFNREIRQLVNPNLRFIITGSIGLLAIVEQLQATQMINDLNTVEIPPLTKSQAEDFVTKLLDDAKVAYQPDTCDELLQRIGQFHPFYLQLAVQEIIGEFESTAKIIESSDVERALNKMLHRRNEHYFEHYYQRLKIVFSPEGFQFALALMNELAEQEHGINAERVQELATEYTVDNHRFILRSLEFDGYLFESKVAGETIYRFTSPILRKWWQVSVASNFTDTKTESLSSLRLGESLAQSLSNESPNLISSALNAAWKKWEHKYGQ